MYGTCHSSHEFFKTTVFSVDPMIFNLKPAYKTSLGRGVDEDERI